MMPGVIIPSYYYYFVKTQWHIKIIKLKYVPAGPLYLQAYLSLSD